MTPASLFLSRHGQTVWHRENRYAGSSDIDLTATGLEQAGELAGWAARVRPAALYVSPLRRARETAAPVEARLGRAATVDVDLREVHFGIAEGVTIGELRSARPDVVAAFDADPVGHHFPEAEPPGDAADRGSAALRRIADRHPGEKVLVVAHNTLIRLILCRLLEIPLSHYRVSLPSLDNGTLTEVRLTGAPGRPAALMSFNVPLAQART